MGWRPEGYVLHVPHSLEERAALLFADRLQKWLDDQDWRAQVRVTPMRKESSTRGTSAELGTVEVTSDVLLTVDAALLRDTIDRFSSEAEEEMEQITTQEMALVKDFIATLQGRPRP